MTKARIENLQNRANNHEFALAMEPLPIPSANGFEDLIHDAKAWQINKASATLDELTRGS